MNSSFTLAIIKPEIVAEHKSGALINRIEENAFSVRALKMTTLMTKDIEEFYAIHKDRPFFPELVSYMASGPVIVLALEALNAVPSFRKLIGATNPKDADPGTIRKVFGKSIDNNAIHGSDSDETAKVEIGFFFPDFFKNLQE
jgi:nucleoside-diphosphate kinase